MLTHTTLEAVLPSRVVILGASGVIGQALTSYLAHRDVSIVAVGSSELDLLDSDAPASLAKLLHYDDALVVLACIPPRRGRDLSTMLQNVRMGVNICAALSRQPVAHAIYVSSDAVYPRSVEEVSEASTVAPTDPYSVMHLVREDLFRRLIDAPVAILRPTQVCALRDTHNAYGPNRFLRTAIQENRIVLFGRGEETRDHIMVDDVAALIYGCLLHRSQGVMNLATGRSFSFADVAALVAAQFHVPPTVQYAPRQVPITHRKFDVSMLVRAFPGLTLTPLETGLSRIVSQIASTGSRT